MPPPTSYPELGRPSPAPRPVPLAEFFGRGVPLLQRAPSEAIRSLARAASVRRHPRGTFLCRAGDPAKDVWFLMEGLVSVNRCGLNGQRRSVELMLPGDVFGLPALACRFYPSEIQAARDCAAAAVPRQALQAAVDRHPVLAQDLLELFGRRLHYVETMLLLSTEPAERRLAAALLYLHHKFGSSLPVTRAEVAEMAGTTPETAMRLLKRLEGRGLLRRRPAGIVLGDTRALRDALERPPSDAL